MKMRKNMLLTALLICAGVIPVASNAGQFIPAPVKPVVAAPLSVNPIISGTLKLHPYSRIVIRGPFDVEVIGSLAASDLRYVGNENMVAAIDAKVVNDTLFLTMSNDKLTRKYDGSSHALVIVRGGQIEALDYAGAGRLSAIGLSAPYLDVHLDNDGPVDLHGPNIHLHHLETAGVGPINIERIDARNLQMNINGSNQVTLTGRMEVDDVRLSHNGWLRLDGVDSPYLRVRGSSSAMLRVSGRTDELDVNLTQHARFNGANLVAFKAFVKTYDEARADIQVEDYQSTLASDHSNIFYYRKPNHQADYMHMSGAVLQFDDLTG